MTTSPRHVTTGNDQVGLGYGNFPKMTNCLLLGVVDHYVSANDSSIMMVQISSDCLIFGRVNHAEFALVEGCWEGKGREQGTSMNVLFFCRRFDFHETIWHGRWFLGNRLKPFESHLAEAFLDLEMDGDQHFVHRLDNGLTGLMETHMTWL